MVAIVSGSSLGLDLTSWRTLGERVTSGPATQGRSNETVAVNVATGNLLLQSADQTLVGRGPDPQLLRTYNSQGLRDDDNGDNWRQSVAPRPIEVVGTWGGAGCTVRRTADDGSVAVHVWAAGSAAYVCTDGDGAHDTIRQLQNGQLEWRDGSTGVTELYAATADRRLLQRCDASGNAQTFNYDTQGRLERVVTPSGEALVYVWSGNNLQTVSTVRSDGSTAEITRYAYDDRNRLIRVTVDLSPQDNSVADGKIYTTSYGYDTLNRLASLVQSDGSALFFDYVSLGGRDRISVIRDALGQTTSFNYALTDGVPGYSTVTDPTGLVTRYDVDAKGQLTGITPPVVGTRSPATTFTCDSNGNLTSRTDGEGRVTTYG